MGTVAWFRALVCVGVNDADPTKIAIMCRCSKPTWENYTLYDNITGVDANGIPTGDPSPTNWRRQVPRHPDVSFSFAYDQNMARDPSTHLLTQVPTIALVRAEGYGTTDPATVVTEGTLLDTEQKWTNLLNAYPTLSNRYPDQPYNL